MISMFFSYLENFLIFSMIGHYLGKEAMAAGRLSFSLLMLSFSIITSLSSGFMILGGRALGEVDNTKFNKYYSCNRKILLYCSILLSLLMVAIKSNIGLLTSFESIQKAAVMPIIISAVICPLLAIAYNSSICLRLLEKVKEDMYCNMASLWIIELPLSYYLGIYKQIGLIGFFIAYLIADLFYAASTYLLVSKYIKALPKSIKFAEQKIPISDASNPDLPNS